MIVGGALLLDRVANPAFPRAEGWKGRAAASGFTLNNRDFAIDTCYPTQNEIALAEARASRFWAKHSSRFGAEPRFLAVETSKIFPGEVQDLWPKLINFETTASFFFHGIESNLQLYGVMIYDTKTGHFVSNQGYISVDTPPRGRVARFGPYIARYIGWG
jgi:hypothetical protein